MSHTATMTDGSEKTYLTCAETAKLVRKALKGAFPGVKFSVRSSTYSGGASISVSWTDGPTTTEVDGVVKVFSGADFDGMIDLKVYCTHWLHPDGSVSLAKREGTTGSLVEILGDPLGPTAQLVHLGADYVFTQREMSAEWEAEVLAEFSEKLGCPVVKDGPYSYSPGLVPLSVDRLNGELYRMVDSETEGVGTLLHRVSSFRSRS